MASNNIRAQIERLKKRRDELTKPVLVELFDDDERRDELAYLIHTNSGHTSSGEITRSEYSELLESASASGATVIYNSQVVCAGSVLDDIIPELPTDILRGMAAGDEMAMRRALAQVAYKAREKAHGGGFSG